MNNNFFHEINNKSRQLRLIKKQNGDEGPEYYVFLNIKNVKKRANFLFEKYGVNWMFE